MLKFKKIHIILAGFLFTASISAYAVTAQLASSIMTGLGLAVTVLGIVAGSPVIVPIGGAVLASMGSALLFSIDNTSPTSQSSSAIQINLNPKQSLITPVGWVAPVAGGQPTPPSSFSASTLYSTSVIGGGSLVSSDAYETALANFALNKTYQAGLASYTFKDYVCPAISGSCTVNAYTGSGVVSNNFSNFTMFVGCPTGYTATGSTCNLSNATLVKKPQQNNEGIIRTGNSFAIDPQINPKDVLPSTTLSVTASTLLFKGSDGSSTSVVINADGSTTVTTSTPITGGSNSKTTITTFGSPDPSTGLTPITGKSESVTAGQGISSSGSAAALDISSLNKESTQNAILSKISSDVDNTTAIKANSREIADNLKCADCPTPQSTYGADKMQVDGEVKKVTDALGAINEDTEEGKFAGLFVPSFATSSCTPFTKTIGGKAIVLDPCETVGKINELFGWLYALFGSWSIVGLIFRRTA